jgi:hypothetical protein
MKFWHLISVLVVALITINCAQPRPLTGGTKDTTAPQIIQSSPKNLSSGFSGHTIAMVFDEYVQIKSLASELVVSPPLKYEVTYRLKGKRVFIDIKDTLLENTTYNFNFGNAIVDLNEGNPLDSNLFVISTGLELDSGYISGIVKDAYTLKPVSNATVILFNAAEDSAIYNGIPSYIAKTNSSGKYELKYLSNKKYQIYVLGNLGGGYNYRPFGKIGFYPDYINPQNQDTANFFIFNETDTAQYISKEFSREHFNFVLGFNSDLKNPKFNFFPGSDTVHYYVEEIQSDSFMFWINGDKDIDSVRVIISDDLGYLDTANLDISDRKKFIKKLKKKKTDKSPLVLKLDVKNGTHPYFETLHLNFNRPPSKWNLDSMSFVNGIDTIPMSTAISEKLIEMRLPQIRIGKTKEIRSMLIKHSWMPNKSYAFIFNSGSFTDLINQSNDTTILKFKTQNFEDYGSFRFTINVPQYDGELLLQLMNEDGKFIRDYKIKSGSVIYHKLAIPGKYKLRLILDANGNQKWDTGDLEKLIQPEELIYYNGIIEIRPNWDMEEIWNVDLK